MGIDATEHDFTYWYERQGWDDEPDVCACGDEEWGACPKDTCYDEYDMERNAR